MNNNDIRKWLLSGFVLIFIAWLLGFATHPFGGILGLLSFFIGLFLTGVAIWNIFSGFSKTLFIIGLFLGFVGMISAMINTPASELLGGFLIGGGLILIFISISVNWNQLVNIFKGEFD